MWLLLHPRQKDAESAKKTAGFAGVTVPKLLGQILENHRIFGGETGEISRKPAAIIT
jgi:hypothetical protein